MKLIELLVQELPKRGGWPNSAIIAESYSHIPGVHFWDTNGITVPFDDLITNAIGKESVTREQYEAALAAAQQPVWNGEGLPPLGARVLFFANPHFNYDKTFSPDQWQDMEVVAHKKTTDGNDVAVCYWDENGCGRAVCFVPECLMPARSAADEKRDEIIEELAYHTDIGDARDLYEAIAAGQVKGVKLDV